MVGTASIGFMAFTALFTIFAPVLAAILFYRKQKYSVGALFTGVGVFTLFQMATRLPLLQMVLPKLQWYQNMAKNIWVYALFLGFTAGLFEEVGRFLAFKLLLKKHLDWKNSVAFGIGHGGIESVLLAGMGAVNNLIYSAMINSGMYDTFVAPALPAGQAEFLKNQLVQTPSYLFLLSSAERVFAFTIHLAFSVLVMNGIRKKKGLLYLGLAIFLHMAVDSPVVVLAAVGVSNFAIEGIILVMAMVALLYVIKSGQAEKLENAGNSEEQF